jgi:hypothetical protein
MLHGHNVTVVVTSSYAKAVHPSISIIAECVLSLRWLDLPPATPVLLAHDSPWVGPGARQATPTADASEQFPNAYLEYLARVHHALPRLRMCTGLAIRSVLRMGHAGLSRNLAFAVKLVRTHFLLKVEHDHLFVRRVPLLAILNDMRDDTRLKFVRFNRRRNLPVKCDRGDYAGEEHKTAARHVWARHTPPRVTELRCNYTRTSCFSDMNHVARTAYYRNRVLPFIVRDPKKMPEAVMQPKIMEDVRGYGTFLFGAPNDAGFLVHADASMHGNGELVPEVTHWVRQQALTRRFPVHRAHLCSSSLPTHLRAP